MKKYTVTFLPGRRFALTHEFDSALMALNAVLDLLRDLRDPDFDWEAGPDQLLTDVVQLMQEDTARGSVWEICVLPGQLYVSAEEEQFDPASGAARHLPPKGKALDEDGGRLENAPTEEDEDPGSESGHYRVVTPRGSPVFRGTEKACADYIARMEAQGGLEMLGYLSIERIGKEEADVGV